MSGPEVRVVLPVVLEESSIGATARDRSTTLRVNPINTHERPQTFTRQRGNPNLLTNVPQKNPLPVTTRHDTTRPLTVQGEEIGSVREYLLSREST